MAQLKLRPTQICMENVISRFRNTANLIVLAAVLVLQVIGLAVQVQRKTESGTTRLIRIWTIALVTPPTRGIVHTQGWFSNTWHNYIWLRDVRKENEDLKDQIAQMQMQQVRMVEDANQARRLQLLLSFKEKYISQTVPAQVISTTGSEFSRAIYIDKGTKDGISSDMPVVAPQGIVGKVLRAYSTTSLVLLINDPTFGAGVILEKSRLQGILKGAPNGFTIIGNIMSDEKVEPGDRIVTSGGDKIFPKGLMAGTVMTVGPGPDMFYNIRVKPAAPINQLEEVLVITKVDERSPEGVPVETPMRAIDILAQRLPTVAPPPPAKTDAASGATGTLAANKPGTTVTNKDAVPKPQGTVSPDKKAVTPQAAIAPEKPKPVKQAQTTPATKPQESTPKDTPR